MLMIKQCIWNWRQDQIWSYVKDFGRIVAQTAKQAITQRVREAERSIIYNEYIDYEDDILTGIVERQDCRYVYVT